MLDFQMLLSLVWVLCAFPSLRWMPFWADLNWLIIYGNACISIGIDGHHFGFGGIDNEACL